jgi:tRNA (guanine37-N1)-methyltransferase
MKFYFLSIFPELFDSVLQSSVIGRALKRDVFSYETINIRDYSDDKHKHIDDHPYGGGAGMVMRADVLEKALLACFNKEGIVAGNYDKHLYRTIVTSASGKAFKQSVAKDLTKYTALFVVCGHYEGIDQRFIDMYADDELRIGDYVLTGGELPALVMADAVVRLLPGALGSETSTEEESFTLRDEVGLLPEYPQYTRPSVFHDLQVPEVLVSGNHADITAWRLQKSQELRSIRELEN